MVFCGKHCWARWLDFLCVVWYACLVWTYYIFAPEWANIFIVKLISKVQCVTCRSRNWFNCACSDLESPKTMNWTEWADPDTARLNPTLKLDRPVIGLTLHDHQTQLESATESSSWEMFLEFQCVKVTEQARFYYSVLAKIGESSWMNNALHHIFQHREHV